MNRMSFKGLLEIRMTFTRLQTLYQTHLPKEAPSLINDLLVREQERRKSFDALSSPSSSSPPFYIVEILANQGTDSEKMRNLVYEKSGLLPSISEKGTRYKANMRLSLELLKVICDFEERIVKINGDFTGGVTGR